MEEGYLAFVHFRGERSAQWTPRLQALGAKLDFALVETKDFVALTRGRAIELRTSGLDGLIIGTLFRRGERQAVTGVTGAETDSILATGGQALVDQFWGNYVALLRGAHSTAILRAPMGDLACYYRHCANGLLAASDPELLFDAVGDRPAIDWDAVARHLIAPNLCRARTCLESVVELAGGDRLSATPAAAVDTLWTPGPSSRPTAGSMTRQRPPNAFEKQSCPRSRRRLAAINEPCCCCRVGWIRRSSRRRWPIRGMPLPD
jgi:asparagine synthase (glutamine-hydrolysing)